MTPPEVTIEWGRALSHKGPSEPVASSLSFRGGKEEGGSTWAGTVIPKLELGRVTLGRTLPDTGHQREKKPFHFKFSFHAPHSLKEKISGAMSNTSVTPAHSPYYQREWGSGPGP